MKTKRSFVVKKCEGNHIRVVRSGAKRPEMPVPECVRQRQQLESWRDRIWRARSRFLVILHPQFRDLTRKIMWSMDRAGLREMIGRFLMGLLFAWVANGTTARMEDFIAVIFRGKVFLMNDRRFLPDDLPSDLPKPDLLKSMLVYDPACHKNGLSMEQALDATSFFAFLGSSPGSKPWVNEWISEVEDLRKQTITELGEDLAKELWGESRTKSSCEDEGPNEGEANLKKSAKSAYW